MVHLFRRTIQDSAPNSNALDSQDAQRLRFVQQFGQEGLWDWDLVTHELRFSPGWQAMLGYHKNQVKWNVTQFEEQIHPGYFPHIRQALQDNLTGKVPLYECQYQVRCQDGHYKWVLDRGMVTSRDAAGKALFFVGSYTDATAFRAFEDKIHALVTRFESTTSAAHLGVIEWDLTTNTIHADRQFYSQYAATGHDFDRALEGWLAHIHPQDRQRSEQALDYALKNQPQFISTFQVMWPNNAVHSLKIAADIIRDDDGKAIKLLGVQWDITREQEIDQQKSEFVSLASHQLRTPLTSIRWFTEALLEDPNISENQRYNAQEIYRGDLRMIDLVDSLLNVSNIELGTLAIHSESIDLVELTKSVLGDLKPQIIARSITIVEDYQDKLPHYQADTKLMRVLLLNLLSNAVKYTKKRGTVRARLAVLDKTSAIGGKRLRRDSLIIEVSDNGIGIPANQQAKIYSKVFRANNAQEEHTEGTGLGLYLLKQIVTKTGGATWFTSVEGKGSSFYVALPNSGMINVANHELASELVEDLAYR